MTMHESIRIGALIFSGSPILHPHQDREELLTVCSSLSQKAGFPKGSLLSHLFEIWTHFFIQTMLQITFNFKAQ